MTKRWDGRTIQWFEKGWQRLEDTGTLGQLLDDVAAFPRLGRQGMTRTDIDMMAVARDAWEEILAARPGWRPSLIVNIFPSRADDGALMRKALHGGVVRGESELDKGTSFYFMLPDRD